MVEHKIAACSMDGVWLKGTVDNYIFCAKICDAPSDSGIDCGRVTNLRAEKYRGWDKGNKRIFSFERIWGKYPQGKCKGSAQALVRFLESLPEQKIWSKTFYKKVRRFRVTEDGIFEYEKEDFNHED